MSPAYLSFAHSIAQTKRYYLVFVGLDGFYAYANDHFNAIFLAPNQDIIGMPFTFSVLEEDHPAMAAAAQHCMAYPEKPTLVTLRKPTINGIITTNWEFIYAKDANGTPTGIMCIGHDITKDLENEIKLKAILNSTVDANLLIGADYKLLSFNNAANASALMVVNNPLKLETDIRAYINDSAIVDFVSNFKMAISGEIIKLERSILSKEGKAFWFEFLYYPVYDDQNRLVGVALNSANIDTRKKAELKVLNQLERLKKIAYLQSHELRAPLTNIMGIINVIHLLLPEMVDPELLELLEGLLSNAQKMDQIVKQIVEGTQEPL